MIKDKRSRTSRRFAYFIAPDHVLKLLIKLNSVTYKEEMSLTIKEAKKLSNSHVQSLTKTRPLNSNKSTSTFLEKRTYQNNLPLFQETNLQRCCYSKYITSSKNCSP